MGAVYGRADGRGRTGANYTKRRTASGNLSAPAELRDHYAEQIRERIPHIPRRVSGYNLDALLPESGFNVAEALVGTEGTCVTILGATVEAHVRA